MCSFCGLFNVIFIQIVVPFVGDLFKMSPKCSAKVLSSFPKHKVVMCFRKKMHVRLTLFTHEL